MARPWDTLSSNPGARGNISLWLLTAAVKYGAEEYQTSRCMAGSHLPSDEGKVKSEVWEFSAAVIERGSKVELEPEIAASDWIEGGTSGLLESFPIST